MRYRSPKRRATLQGRMSQARVRQNRLSNAKFALQRAEEKTGKDKGLAESKDKENGADK